MTQKRDIALALAAKGFHVFPLAAGSKMPDIDGWQRKATTDATQIKRWWTCPVTELPLDRNIGICTTRFGDNGALVVLDVDNKNDVSGDDTLLELEIAGADIPATLEGQTPTGGRHLIYYHPRPLNHRKAGFLGAGLDVRSRGGYIVAIGSDVDTGTYTWSRGQIANTPKWLVDKLGEAPTREKTPQSSGKAADDDWALARARELLDNASETPEGQRNDAAYRMACRLRDLGLTEASVSGFLTQWNLETCTPPLEDEELDRTINSAYRTAQNPQGASRPDVEFAEAPETAVGDPEDVHPLEKFNQDFALILTGGSHHILWETTDAKGRETLEHLSEQAFHRYFNTKKLPVKGKDGEIKPQPLTKVWIEWQHRRSYRGLCFRPGLETPDDFYNLWRGFRVTPVSDRSAISKRGQEAVAAFYEHCRENICGGNQRLYEWLITYFAHMVQCPFEKPLTALVLRGGKGTGKNAVVDRIGKLLGPHYLSTSNRRYLTGNFNSHLERMLFFVLDEAFWSGDKAAEGQLKDLVTGHQHVIERKGQEPYTVDNLARIAILGNEEWVVPASEDERRWAVFNVGDGRKQDRAFFTKMRQGIDEGDGGRLLLRDLLDWDLEKADVNAAPNTRGLAEQKVASLEPLPEWWFSCINEGHVLGSEFNDWPEKVRCDRLYMAFCRHAKDRGIRSRLPEQRSFGRQVRQMCRHLSRQRARGDGDGLIWVYALPALSDARKDFERYMGQDLGWDEEDEDTEDLLS